MWKPVTASLSQALPLLFITLLLAVPVFGGRKQEFTVTIEDVLQEVVEMRRELRELKIQRDRDQREISDLRSILENQVPGFGIDQARPAVAQSGAAATTGGAGNRRTSCAPAFSDGTGAAPASCRPALSVTSSSAAPSTMSGSLIWG